MTARDPQCLMLYVEPTTYVLSFVAKMRALAPDRVSALFIATNRSQAWNIAVPEQIGEILPPGRIRAVLRIFWWVNPKRCVLLHLAGWGHPLLLIAMMLAVLRRIPVFLESDTQLAPRAPRWKQALKRVLYPLMFSLPARLLPGGSRQAAYMKHYGAKDKDILVARMTVDVTTIAREVESRRASRDRIRRELGLADEDVAFLYVGRLAPVKGIAILVNGFLAARGPASAMLDCWSWVTVRSAIVFRRQRPNATA